MEKEDDKIIKRGGEGDFGHQDVQRSDTKDERLQFAQV